MFRRLASDESGIALVLAVITMIVLASLTASVVFAVTQNQRNAGNSKNAAQAFALAEQGLAYAQGRLYTAAGSSNDPNLVPAAGPYTQDGGSFTYSGTLVGSTWTLTGTGTMGTTTRTVSVQATVPASQTVADPTIWNYLYANSTASCSTSITDGININVPLYTQGGLCDTTTNKVNFTGADLEIGGNLTYPDNKFFVGKQKTPISKMNIHGTCQAVPCDGAHDPIYVHAPGVGNTLTPSLSMPTVDLSGNYSGTNPGPTHACQAGSGVPSPFFDSNTTLNNSVATINLFPAGQPYDCKIGSNEIKWDGSQLLTVNGTFYFDGSLSLASNNAIYIYTGSGTLYFTGTITVSGNHVSFCGLTGTKYDNHGQFKNCKGEWNPDTNGVILVAGCWNHVPESNPSSPSLATSCVNLSGDKTILQVGILAKTGYNLTGDHVSDQGPVLADTLTFAEETDFTQMRGFHTLPPGAPSNGTTTIYPPALAPSTWNG